jgi:hypothetical protein
MDIEFLKNKKISDITTKETKVVKVPYHISEEIGEGLKLSDQLGAQNHEDLTVISDYRTELMVCFKADKAVAIFYVYEPRYISLYGERGLVVAVGNGNIHVYWFNNGEYIEDWY